MQDYGGNVMLIIVLSLILLFSLVFVGDCKRESLHYGRLYTRRNWWINFGEILLIFTLSLTIVLLVIVPILNGILNWATQGALYQHSLLGSIIDSFNIVVKILNLDVIVKIGVL